MKTRAACLVCFAPSLAAILFACGGTTEAMGPDASTDAATDHVEAATADGSSGIDAPPDTAPGACDPLTWPGDGGRPAWATGDCPDAGCGPGMTCIEESIACCARPVGCAPTSCGCTVCGGLPCTDAGGGLTCETPTQSRRAVKADIAYVGDAERESLAAHALEMRLARYRYKTEPATARRRLGFLIDDQPDPSPAVDADREHVDQYGYTSLLLATVQEQAKELRELRDRVDALEHRRAR